MVHIYISDHCRGYHIAQQLGELLKVQRPHVPVTIINLDTPGSDWPAYVIGTPLYTWNERILFMGNPSVEELLNKVDHFYDIQNH